MIESVARKFAVRWKLRDIKIDTVIGDVSTPLLEQGIDHLFHLFHILGGFGTRKWFEQFQRLFIFQILLGVALGDLKGMHFFLLCLLLNFVITLLSIV